MNTAKSYPVFEADQVLTNRHLNDMFNYLEQHDRLTRIKLIGSGIVCGLEVSFQQNESISISKGCGLTSQGYLITCCDTVFTHFMPYNTRNFPADLLFIQQCDAAAPIEKPFYRDAFNDGIFQLLSPAQLQDLKAGEKQNAVAFSDNSKVDLKKYAVVVFLETEEENLKNCDTNDCNDKGSRMDFEVKALLIEKALLDNLKLQQEVQVPVGKPTVTPDLHHVELKRYNVPVQDLKSSDEVLQAFAALVDDTKLRSISEVLNYCFIHYYYLLDDESSNPFENVFEQFKKTRDEILKNSPILIQYYFDFIDDVLKAYYEFKHKVFEVSTSCCGDELKFPLHLKLGEATENTSAEIQSNYREYFVYSPLFDNQKNKLAEIRLLFTRLKLLISMADFASIRDFGNNVVRVTPSRYGQVDLSERCIPFHYNVTNPGNELYRYWNYDKTRRGNYRFNLGYNAFQYCTADNVVQPLLYDIERFDFFRVEGHIGKNVTQAMTLIKTQQQQNNLPFDITALSADYIGALVRGEEPQCVIEDLESDYRVLIAEYICKAHDAFCFAAKLPFVIPDRILNFTAASLNNVSAADASTLRSTLSFNANILERVSHPFTSALVNEFQAVKKYVKGDTLLKLCNPGANTIGSAYINMKGSFTNPVTINTDQPLTSIQFHAFEFVDAIESILELVMNNELADVDTLELKNRYDRLEKEIRVLSAFAVLFLQTLENNDQSHLSDLASDMYLDLLIFNLETLLNACFVEQVEALKSEYNRRMAQYRLARNFSYYFKNHGGIEHKAGVPKGGTFILVYHEERRNRFIDKNALFINKDLANLMVSRFRDLIQPDVPIDTLTYQTKLLQTSILYKDPELFIRFKDVLTQYLDDCKDLPDDKRKDLTDLINREPRPVHFELTDGMVIADFYIPYMCCSDCPPIAYILPGQPQEPEAPTISIATKSFCSIDNASYPVTVTPKGGVASGTGLSVLGDGSYVFKPSVAGTGIQTLTYTANGKTVAIQVEVIASPIANFSYSINVDGNQALITLTNETTGSNAQTAWEWLRDGKSFSKDETPAPFTFKTEGPIKNITLKASNGDCPSEITLDIVVPLADPTLNIDKTTFCNNDKTEYPLMVTPAGGTLSGDGTVTRADGTLVFVPAAVKTPGQVTLAYAANGKTATLSVEVSPMPVAQFSFETITEGSEITVMLKNESTGNGDKTKYAWLLDGKPFSDNPDPGKLAFKIETLPHTILLNVVSGECLSVYSQVVEQQVESRTIVLCSNEKRVKLEPNLTPTDTVKVLSNDGIKMRDATLEVSPASTTIDKTTDFHVSYLVNNKQVDVTITLLYVEAGFMMNLTRNTSPVAVFPTILTLSAKLPDAEKYTWTITTVNGRVINLTGRETALNYQQNDLSAGTPLTITITVGKTDQTGVACENTATFILTEAIFGKHINQGAFDNLTTA